MEWWAVVVGGVGTHAVVAIGAMALERWRQRRRDAQWTLERVHGSDWTLRRDSRRVALSVRIWEESNGMPGTVHFTEGFGDSGNDLGRGDQLNATGLAPGVVALVGWIENDRRQMARVLVRDSADRIEILRKDVV